MCKIVVVDDEHLEIESFKHIVSEMENVQIIGEGRCGRVAVELCATLKPDGTLHRLFITRFCICFGLLYY